MSLTLGILDSVNDIVVATYPTTGLVARYALDASGIDSGPNGYHFNLTGATYTAGVSGDASTALVMANNDKNNTTLAYRRIINNTNSFSISCFIKTTQKNGIIWAADGANSSPYKRVWFQLTDNAVSLQRYHATSIGGGGCAIGRESSGLTNSNTWKHVVGIYNNAADNSTNAWIVYIDASGPYPYAHRASSANWATK